MRLGVIAFLVGILILHVLPELPARYWTLLLPVLLALALTPWSRLPAWGAAGFLWALLWASPSAMLPTEREGVDVWVEGWIASIPDREGRSIRFEFVTDQVGLGEKSVALAGRRLRLSWWDDAESGEASPPESQPELRVGDRWGFAARLKQPRGLSNPGGFDDQYRFVSISVSGTLRR